MNLTDTSTNTSDTVETMEILINEYDPWVVLAISLIGLVIIVGCTGNIMVLLAVRKIKKLQTVSNVFIINLSVCDLIFIGCVLPFNIYTYIVDGWYIATSLCKFVGFMGYTLTGTTIITITLIAYNRYKLVLDPGAYNQLYTRRNIIIMLMIAWLIPITCLVPALIGVWGEFGYVVMLVTCNLLLDHESQTFKIFLMVVRAIIPCGLIVYYYARIYHTTRTSHRRLNRNNNTLSALDLHNQKKEMHMTRMMLIIFLVFIISYFPCTITGMVDWNIVLSKQFHMFCQISVYIGSAVNPLVYGLMNSQFRHAYLRIICCCSRESKELKKYATNTTSTKDIRGLLVEASNICRISNDKRYLKRSKNNAKVHNYKYRNVLTATEDRHTLRPTESSKGKSYESLLQVSIVDENDSKRPTFTLD